MITRKTLASSIGPIVLTTAGGAITGLYLNDPPPGEDTGTPTDPLISRAKTQLDEYFAGERRDFDLPFAPIGTPFQHRVWEELRRVGYGETITYGELARRIGAPNAARAVGLANGKNPISILIPCHRVIGASGKMTGYAGGVERKIALLDLERGESLLTPTR